MKLSHRLLTNLCIGLISSLFLSCSDDSGSPSGNSANGANSNADFNGTYTGNYTYVETNKSTGSIDTTLVPNFSINIGGTNPSYVMTVTGNANSALTISTSGNTFTGANGSGFFEGSTYSGSLNGDLITVNEIGEDSAASWRGEIIANRPTTSGGGNSGDFLSVSGSSAGAKISANSDIEFTAVFNGPSSGQNWDITIGNSFEELSNFAAGSYPIGESSNSANELEIELWLTDSNGPLIELGSKNNSGNIVISVVGGKQRIEANNIPMLEDGVGDRSVSFRITSD